MKKTLKNLSREPIHPYSSTFFVLKAVPNAAMPGHHYPSSAMLLLLVLDISVCSYTAVSVNATENPPLEGTYLQLCKYQTPQEQTDSNWTGAYQSASASLCQTFATEEFTLKKPHI